MNKQTLWSKENIVGQVTFDVHADPDDDDIHSGKNDHHKQTKKSTLQVSKKISSPCLVCVN